jgi:hypothetical protein
MKNLNRFIVLVMVIFFILVVGCKENPVADSSVIETQKAEQPMVEQPMVEQPQDEHPKAEHPSDEPSTLDHPE